jgi:hypothetical protein
MAASGGIAFCADYSGPASALRQTNIPCGPPSGGRHKPTFNVDHQTGADQFGGPRGDCLA